MSIPNELEKVPRPRSRLKSEGHYRVTFRDRQGKVLVRALGRSPREAFNHLAVVHDPMTHLRWLSAMCKAAANRRLLRYPGGISCWRDPLVPFMVEIERLRASARSGSIARTGADGQ